MSFELADAVALALFLTFWLAYNWITDKSPYARHGLSVRMNRERENWMRVMLGRDLRMIDTAIMAGLQQGTAFFASTCIFAIGGCFALLGSADLIAQIGADLSTYGSLDRALVEIKLLGLVVIFAYAFFKFGWSYRLFNYCSILIGAIPMPAEAERHSERAEEALTKAVRLNQLAGRNFNAGLRAIFFSLAYLGWFLGPYALVLTTLLVIAVVGYRQFFSQARDALGQ